jgi:predicted phage baseplate assembly protein
MIELPKIDERSSEDIAREVLARLRLNRLREEQLKGRFDVALVHVFSRFSEMVIERLNRAPEKKLLAFLELLGVSPLPMEAATVPLTFSIAPASDHAIVRAGTQVAASPSTGSSHKPIIFETQADLVVTSAQLDSLFVKNGADAFANLCAALPPATDAPASHAASPLPDSACVSVFQQIEHLFYVSIPCNSNWQTIDRVTLQFALDPGARQSDAPLELQWEIPGAAPGAAARTVSQIMSPAADTTSGLRQSGAIAFAALPAIRTTTVGGQPACWLCCRLLTPLSGDASAGADAALPSVPRIREVMATCERSRAGVPIEQAFYEKQALDVTKAVFPFGARPRLGDAFYLGCREAFSEQGANITLHVDLFEAPAAPEAIPLANPSRVELCWEFWNGQSWVALNAAVKSLRIGSESSEAAPDAAAATNFSDGTASFSRSGAVSFTLPAAPAELSLNGVKNYWVRVRIAGGDYGRETQVVKDAVSGALTTIPSTLSPPSIRALKVDYALTRSIKPDIVTMNAWNATRIAAGMPFDAFTLPTADDRKAALYLGFRSPNPAASGPAAAAATVDLPPAPFPRFAVNAYFVLDEQSPQQGARGAEQVGSAWEYWSEVGWKRFTVADHTQSLRRSGLIQFLIPADFVSSVEFGRQRHWVRMQLAADQKPAIRAVLLNTTPAVEGVTVRNEILGSSSGEPHQRFRAVSPTILPGQLLEVCEPTLPSLAEQEALRRDSQTEDFFRPGTAKRSAKGYWIPWSEVATFHASAARDRHYVVDHTTGEVFFGDGVCGMIPPIVAGNIRLTSYRTGGGAQGNLPAQAIKQLISAVPSVQKVVNWLPASGGNDCEPDNTILERGPREIRHGGRAVTMEDYEDLAMRASRQVARARCVPQSDLISDPTARLRKPGLISVVVVPGLADAKPVPGRALLDDVRSYLDARRLATAELVVVGPEYVRLDVEAEIVVERAEDASDVAQRVDAALKDYLHPVRGGPFRSGWDFGRVPQPSDLYVLIERIGGVSHIRRLKLTPVPERAGIEKTRHFLTYCGQRTLSMSL